MTHAREAVSSALTLAESGASATEIGLLTGVPRRTVVDWIAGRVPSSGSADRCSRCGTSHDTNPDAPETIYAYLLGLYLGDGYLAPHPREVFRLRITLDARYPGIIDEAAAAIDAVLGRTSARRLKRVGDFEVYAYSKAWPCLFPQHGPGKKHERPIVLAPWQQSIVDRHPDRLLRGLIQSDGCRFVNTGRNWTAPRYSFSNRSADIHRIFCDACDQLGLRWTRAPHTTYVSRVADVARMDEFIGPKA
jgi:hypothetical protein